MESYLAPTHYDLVSPDGAITHILKRSPTELHALVHIEAISPTFVGFHLPIEHVQFNIKSTLAQLGVNGKSVEMELDPKRSCAQLEVVFTSTGELGTHLLPHLRKGCYIGKLFAADPRRRVRNPDYLLRMFGRFDREGLPLLLLGGGLDSKDLHIEKGGEFTVAHLSLKKGVLAYDEGIENFLPTLATALSSPQIETRKLITLHQKWREGLTRTIDPDKFLLVQTLPLHIRTAFARVVSQLLPEGVHHTSANVLQPDTKASGDIYELYGHTEKEITEIPLEFYTLEPHREHVFFSDRDQLRSSLEHPESIFRLFDTAPKQKNTKAAIFVVKGEQMLKLTPSDWILRQHHDEPYPGAFPIEEQPDRVQHYIQKEPSYPFLKAIEEGLITSQGVLFTRYFPSPLMKKMLLGDYVQRSLKRIYFQNPSYSHGSFFSHEDRTMLLDLARFGIAAFWVDPKSGKILQFAPKPEKDTGMFVPLDRVEEFSISTVFGVYGSTLIKLPLENQLTEILEGVLEMRKNADHPLLNPHIPLSLVTGGGPGLMEMGNRVARALGILSCANIVDFKDVEKRQNPYIDAKMTYRVDRLVERQGEFNLDFPIFLMGGFGTDFELSLELVRRKVEIAPPTPVLLLGPQDYWKKKISSQFATNLSSGTIKGSEWISNCFYSAQSADKAVEIYKKFFQGELPIGPEYPPASDGFYL